ncbi:hypothetical protein ES705_18737 [subsurface metagenome]
MKNVKKIVLYSNGSDVYKLNDVSWNPGFNFFIQRNGAVQGGIKKSSQTEIVKICMHGRKEFTNDQFRRLAALVRRLAEVAKLKNGFLVPETDDFDVKRFIKSYMPEFTKEGIGKLDPKKPKPKKAAPKVTGSVKVESESKATEQD